MDCRLSPKSDSSVEPMDISAKTSSNTDVSNSSIVPQTHDHNDSEENFESDDRPDNYEEMEGDDDDDETKVDTNSKHTRKLRHVVRRENLRQLENSIMVMRKKNRYSNNFRMAALNNKNNSNNTQYTTYDKDNGETAASNDNSKSQYCCPICGVNSPTQHEFTEHIRGHNNADGNQNFTCRICFKVNEVIF